MPSYIGATDPLIDAKPGSYTTEVFDDVEIKGDPADVPKLSIIPLVLAVGVVLLFLKS
jgi:hypothetical protein